MPGSGFFDEVAVGYTTFGPVFREMVGIKLAETAFVRSAACNDMFLVTAAFVKSTDFAAIEFVGINKHKVAHPSGGRRRNRG